MATVKFTQESRQSICAMKGVISYCLQEKKVADDALVAFPAMERTHLLNS
ncbi:hypothetical protein [Acutalibacter intestini]|nr:hypothetical protein [Acutalibacter sp. M00204]